MITSSIILFLTFAGSLYLESILPRYYKAELFVLGLAILFGFIIVAGEAFRGRWVWKFSAVYYSLAMGNLVCLFLVTKNFLVFSLTLLVALVGFIRAVSKLEYVPEENDSLQTYDVETPAQTYTPDTVDPIIVQTTETKKTATKKSKKKSSNKKRSKKAKKR